MLCQIWLQLSLCHSNSNSKEIQFKTQNSNLCSSTITKSTWWRHHMETLSALLALCEGNAPVTGGFHSQKGQWRGANGKANNRGAGDLRHRRTNYDVTVMNYCTLKICRPICSTHQNHAQFLSFVVFFCDFIYWCIYLFILFLFLCD